MASLRNPIGHHRRFSMLVAAMALAMKALLPAGYMLAEQSRVLTILICADASHAEETRQIAVPVAGKADGGDDHGNADGTCPYSALSMASMGGADALLLATALVFALALAFAGLPCPPVSATRCLRPPLRGPPIMACPAHP